MAKQRLDKLIASMGQYSRNEVKQLIKKRQIIVNDSVPAPEDKVDPETDRILICGEPLFYSEFTYLMLHKPAGVITATLDARERTVLDLLPANYQKQGLAPVGRLDKDTEGLLLITNDGQLTHELLSPKKHVDKVYYVKADGVLTQEDTNVFAAGITLRDGTACLPAELEILSNTEALITIQEGKYHQVKRMFAAIGKPVLYLKRLKMGSLELDPSLAAGEFRPLTEEEINLLKLR